MARRKRKRIEAADITGLKYFDKLRPLLARLHVDSCERDKADRLRWTPSAGQFWGEVKVWFD